MNAELAKKEKDSAETEQKLIETQASNIEIKSQLAQMEQEREDALKQLKENNEEILALRKEYDDLFGELDRTAAELKVSKSKVSATKAELEDAEKKLKSTQATLTKKMSEFKDLNLKIKSYELAIDKKKSSDGSVEALRREKEELNKQVQERDKIILSLSALIKGYKSQLKTLMSSCKLAADLFNRTTQAFNGSKISSLFSSLVCHLDNFIHAFLFPQLMRW